IREGNRWRYAELLGKGGRFESWAGRADLAFKLTLAWFGLPVAPLGRVDGRGGGVGGGREEGEGEGGGQNLKQGELRFLNGYRKRVYGRDVGVRELDPEMEAYYVQERGLGRASRLAPSLGLRGGHLNAPRLGSQRAIAEEDDTALHEDNQVSLRGGAGDDDDEGDDDPDGASVRCHTILGGNVLTFDDRWVPLYGYQGLVWFQVNMMNSFIDAVDRLLGLDNRAGVTYSLYLMDKNKTYSTQAERDEFLSDLTGNGITIGTAGVGDFSRDNLAWKWAMDRLGALHKDGKADQGVLFVAGPVDPIPWTWEPGPSHRVLQISLDWCDPAYRLWRPDVAYLRMPENPEDVIYYNMYGPWMEMVCRVLTPGRIANAPGYPAIPDAFFSVKERGRKARACTYGGIVFLPEQWESIVSQWKADPNARVTLEATVRSELGSPFHQISDRWHVFIPGAGLPYEKQYILHDEIEEPEVLEKRIINLVQRSVSKVNFEASEVKELEFGFDGAAFLLSDEPWADYALEMPDYPPDQVELEVAFQELAEELTARKVELEQLPPADVNGLGLLPRFVTIRPTYNTYTICDVDESTEPVDWDPDTTTVDEFRQIVASLWSEGEHEKPYSPWQSGVAIFQGRTAQGTIPAEYKPKLLVGPKATEEDWTLLRRLIVEPEVFISVLDRTQLPRFGNRKTEQPFGFREIYATPEPLLYSMMNAEPGDWHPRYVDWQANGEDVRDDLKTIAPWVNQPTPLSHSATIDQFPLQPPPGTKLPPAKKKGKGAAGKDTKDDDDDDDEDDDDGPPGPSLFVTDVEKGRQLREFSYAHPLDVGMHMSVPVNAPPVDSLLNLGHDSVPVVSLSVLTPTEIRRLQRDHHDMRNLVLSRTERCPYPECGAVYPANQPSAMQQHLYEKHMASAPAKPAPVKLAPAKQAPAKKAPAKKAPAKKALAKKAPAKKATPKPKAQPRAKKDKPAAAAAPRAPYNTRLASNKRKLGADNEPAAATAAAAVAAAVAQARGPKRGAMAKAARTVS
ncbi:hypothetical protein N658DRAFT_395566, partial [Parathielavia hyrcaniae]